jgi:hypothetical protein
MANFRKNFCQSAKIIPRRDTFFFKTRKLNFMKKTINRQWPLDSRPFGDIKESNFEYREEVIPSI